MGALSLLLVYRPWLASSLGKGQTDLAISVVKNSVAQTAAFLFPALVLVSLLFAHALTFDFAPVYIGALFLTAIAIWQITGDGEVVLAAFPWVD